MFANLKARIREFIADAAREGCADHRIQSAEMHKTLAAHFNRVEDRITALVEGTEKQLTELRTSHREHVASVIKQMDRVFTSSRRVCAVCGNLACRFFVSEHGVTCHDCQIKGRTI